MVSRSSWGRARLPTCVVRIRSVLLFTRPSYLLRVLCLRRGYCHTAESAYGGAAMKALVLAPGGLEVADVGDPHAAVDGVVVEVHSCGICGSDVHWVETGRGAPGHILGHEF